MSAPIKFHSLELNNKYTVIGYQQIKSKFGDSYIFQVTDENGNEFELWSIKHINEYISSVNNSLKKFTFIVCQYKDKLIPVIEGYSHTRNFVKLYD